MTPFDGSRRSIDVAGLSHNQLPIPLASRVGHMVATGGIRGVERATNVMPASAEEQAINMFANLRTAIEAGGATASDILKLTIWIATPEARAAIDGPWLALFPDAAARPARHILNHALPGGMLVQCEALAVLEA
jgi:2-iminobutanoate/2-iminopropanoate deaminase